MCMSDTSKEIYNFTSVCCDIMSPQLVCTYLKSRHYSKCYQGVCNQDLGQCYFKKRKYVYAQ